MGIKKYLVSAALVLSAGLSGCKSNISRINQLESRVVLLEQENKRLSGAVREQDTISPKTKTFVIPNLEGVDVPKEVKKVLDNEKSKIVATSKSYIKPAQVKSKLFCEPRGEFGAEGGGKFILGWRNITSDRASGNEASFFYVGDLEGTIGYDNFGVKGRVVVNTPTGKRARFYDEYSHLNEDFDLRELHVFYNDEKFGDFKFGKFRLPLGTENEEEHSPWRESLLETYLNRGGRYDIGAMVDKKFFNDFLRARLAITGGTRGELDTNSAVMISGDLGINWKGLQLGVWGRSGTMETTPIKEDAQAVGLYAELIKKAWRFRGKCGLLKQGLRTTEFKDADLENLGYNDYEAELLFWERDNGGGTRTIPAWSVRLDVPVIRDGRLKVFSEFSQIRDKEDPFEKTRERLTLGVDYILHYDKNCKIYVVVGASLDNCRSNGRPYLDMEEELDERNGHQSFFVELNYKF